MSQLEMFVRNQKSEIGDRVSNRYLSMVVRVLGLDQDTQKVRIDGEVVKVLTQELRNNSLKIKEIALLELGNIGKEEATPALEAIIKCLWDSDAGIRSVACWSMARVCREPPGRKTETRLVELLRDNFWKVRTSACIALGLTVTHPHKSAIEGLIRCLQDGSIPKTVVCESLARMGA